ncbi:MAG: hypothetical protein LBL09_02850 [Oscillospiraceae bacterium]|nr:hypothetical protein [Oscillospiraceae bacterium]
MRILKSAGVIFLAAALLFSFGGCVEEIIISVEAYGDMSVVYCDGGARYFWGSNASYRTDSEDPAATEPEALTAVSGLIDFACGQEHTVWLTNSGLYMSGNESLALAGSSTSRLGSARRLVGSSETALLSAEAGSEVTVIDISTADIVSVEAGDAHTVVLKSDGTVWAWGDNSSGQLGNSSMASSDTPVRVGSLEGISSISTSGDGTSAAVDMDGGVWIWGPEATAEGVEILSAPRCVSGLEDIAQVVCGNGFRGAVKLDGTVWTWGQNSGGELGLGITDTVISSPRRVELITGAISITAGAHFMTCVDSDGAVWTWGQNDKGQLGRNTEASFDPAPGMAEGLEGIIGVSSGLNHSVALKKDGSVLTWGANDSGQLGRQTEEAYGAPGKIKSFKASISIA